MIFGLSPLVSFCLAAIAIAAYALLRRSQEDSGGPILLSMAMSAILLGLSSIAGALDRHNEVAIPGSELRQHVAEMQQQIDEQKALGRNSPKIAETEKSLKELDQLAPSAPILSSIAWEPVQIVLMIAMIIVQFRMIIQVSRRHTGLLSRTRKAA